MKCPVCNTVDLLMTERQAVEIDYCPQCRGIWLDRGELEKIIDRTQMTLQPAAGIDDRAHYGDHDDDDDHRGFGKQAGRGRRRGFLGEMFDF
ncbi:MAG: zf-TFIIB domain-containing protein [Bacteroidota bacterium]